MATINQLRVERRAFFQELKRAVRSVDSAVEALQRRIQRILDRRLNVPDLQDYSQTMDDLLSVARALEEANKTADTGMRPFSGGF